MKKFIITEEERSRILGMHKSATSRQYLMEATGYQGPAIPDAPKAYNYFIGFINKNKKLDKGTTWLGTTTHWTVTEPWQEGTGEGIQGSFCRITMRGITKRNNFFDVTTDNESITTFKLVKTAADTSLVIETSNQGENWLPKTQTLKMFDPGTPGGNAALVGGLENFKKMVRALPDADGLKYRGFLGARARKELKPDPNYGSAPKDQWDLYPAPTTTTATPTKQPVKKP